MANQIINITVLPNTQGAVLYQNVQNINYLWEDLTPSVEIEVRSFVVAVLGSNGVVGETPTGVINGSNAKFESLYNFDPLSIEVILNGQILSKLEDYNTAGTRTINLFVSPNAGEILRINYTKI